jgi:hypothetical protein
LKLWSTIRLQARRLQKDVQLLRQDLNEAEVDRENLSLGLQVASVHYQVGFVASSWELIPEYCPSLANAECLRRLMSFVESLNRRTVFS